MDRVASVFPQEHSMNYLPVVGILAIGYIWRHYWLLLPSYHFGRGLPTSDLCIKADGLCGCVLL